MRRIYVAYILRKLFSPTSMKIVILFAVLRESFSAVSIPSVIANSPSILNPIASYQFFLTAFFTTETTVRVLFIATLALTIWLIQDFLKKTPAQTYQHSF